MFAIGHFALGYLTGKPASTVLKTKLNIPLLLVASVLPDIDLLLKAFFPNIIMHRLQTHSLITYTILMIPFFIKYRKKAIPYYVALLSHSLIGDFFTGGVGIFWPLTYNLYGIRNISVASLISIIAEITLFAISVPIMIYMKDLQQLLKPNKYNLTLLIPFFAVLGPMLRFEEATNMENSMPLLLLVPSLIWLGIFAYSILIELRARIVLEASENVMLDLTPKTKTETDFAVTFSNFQRKLTAKLKVNPPIALALVFRLHKLHVSNLSQVFHVGSSICLLIHANNFNNS